MAPRRSQRSWRARLGAALPVVAWAREYDRSWFSGDLVAGVTVGAAVVPEAMAYASLAGLPPETGLYASLAAVSVYLFVGTSRQVVFGPTSALAVLLLTQVGAVAAGAAGSYAALVGVTTLLVGAVAALAWLFRLGFAMNFVSGSVLTGFSAGAALFIVSTQLPKLLGLPSASGTFYERVWAVGATLTQLDPATAAVGLAGLGALAAGERYVPRLPTTLAVVVLAIAASSALGLAARGVDTVGQIPGGLPDLVVPTAAPATVAQLLPVALALFVLSYVEGMAAAETFAQRHGYRVDADQELLATGLTNALAGLGQGFVVGGSMSRSALNDAIGARTQLVNAVVTVVLVLVLLFLTGVLEPLPEPILAAVVVVAVTKLVDVPELRRLARVDRWEFLTAAVALVSVLVLGLLYGVFAGVLVSLLVVLGRATSPHTAELGRSPGSTEFSDLARHPDDERVEGVLVYRVDAELFFANVPAVRRDLLARLGRRDDEVRLVVFDMRSSPTVDLTAADMLHDLHDRLADRGIDLRLAEADGAVRDTLERADSDHPLCGTPVNERVAAVIDAWERTSGDDTRQ